MKTKTLTIIFVAVVALAIFAGLWPRGSSSPMLGSADYNLINSFTSDAVLASTTASTLLVATTSSRLYLAVSNNDATAPIYLGLGAPAQRNKGILIPARGTYEFDGDNMFFGAIFVTSASTTAATTTYAQGTRY